MTFTYRCTNNFLKTFTSYNKLANLEGAMRTTHQASLQEVLSPNIMDSIKHLLKSNGNVFVFRRKSSTPPLENQFLREAAQESILLLTKCYKGSKDIDRICALSFTNAGPCQLGVLVHIWFYSKKYDPSILIAHLYMAVDRVTATIGHNDLALMVHFPKQFNVSEVERGLETRLGSRMKEGPIHSDKLMCGTGMIKSNL